MIGQFCLVTCFTAFEFHGAEFQFQQNILNFMAAGARQSSHFSDKISGFSKIISQNFYKVFCITYIVLPNCNKISP